jgi:hypothetical protein
MRLRALIDAMPIANGLLKPANIPISNRRIGDRGCTGNYRCGETRAGRHFPRAQERENASQENKVPGSNYSDFYRMPFANATR